MVKKCIIEDLGRKARVLAAPDSHHLDAAEGWLALGDLSGAHDELKKMSLRCRFHPRVLLVRWEICAQQQLWEGARVIAQGMVTLVPDDPSGWINRSVALHALKRTPEAWQSLLPAADKFANNPLVAYNLACYAAQLGRFKEANQWLEKSMSLDTDKRLKWISVKDPDLHPLWEHFAATKPEVSFDN
jgi:tetratricopeptide (TPR) repeat protein